MTLSKVIVQNRNTKEIQFSPGITHACEDSCKFSFTNTLRMAQLLPFRFRTVKQFKNTTGLDKQNFSVKMKAFSYPSVLIYVLGAQKNLLIEAVLLSTHNICFD